MAVFSIIRKSQLEGGQRLDAEYYQPQYLTLDKLGQLSGDSLAHVATCIPGFAFPSQQFGPEGTLPIIKMTQITGDGFVDLSESEFLSDEFCHRFPNVCKRFHAKRGDIAVALTGATIGKSGIILDDQSLLNQRVLLCRAKTSPGYLWALLSTKIFQNYIVRGALGGAQPNVSPTYATHFYVPRVDKKEEERIERMVDESIGSYNQSNNLYSQAEQLLLQELGLVNFEETAGLWNVVRLSEAQTAGRIDAEYFQPKYEKLIAQLGKNNSQQLGDLVTVKKGVEPGSEAYTEEGKMFIRVSSISKFGLADKDQKYISDQLHKELKNNYEPKVGEILLTKDASPGVACVLREKVEGVVSGGVLRLKVKENIGADYLALCINSIVGRLQVERDAGGSIIAHWKPDQIKQVRIPVLPEKTQQKIAELVRQSHEARTKAKQLLEEAKRRVEQSIESASTER